MGLSLSLTAQTDVLTIEKVGKQTWKRGASVTIPLQVKLQPGYHVNSHTPSEAYLIPFRVTWDAKPLESGEAVFPNPKLERYEFAEKPLSVFTGDFAIQAGLRVPDNAPPGLGLAKAKVRFQACSHTYCLPPKTLEVQVPYEIR